MATRTARRTRSASKRKAVEAPVVCDIPPLAHLHFEGDRHLHPQRLPSAKKERLVSLRLLDTQPYTVENVRKIGQFLKRVTISGLRLTVVPIELLESLPFLEKLDLSENRLHDASIPEEFRNNLDNLVELNLNGNKFARVPAFLKKVKNLSRLDIGHNKLDSLKGVEKLKRLQVLIAEHNVLTSVVRELVHLKKLETVCCANNNIREIQPEIRHIRSLREIDLSENKISILLPDVFFLPRLEVLNVSSNRIAKIPSFTVKLMSRHWIQHVDISENTIVRFPEHLLLIVKKLDLSGNKIKVLLSNVLKKMDWKTDQELILENNPFTYPSADVCTSGLKAIVHFFQEVKAESSVHQGVKVIVLGSQGSGKSSLVQSLVDQQPRLEEGGQSSCGIECYDTGMEHSSEEEESDNSLSLCLWDFGGHPAYLYPQCYFVEYSSVSIVTFNMAAYSTLTFDQLISSWFDWMISINNRLVTVVVGTQSDRLRPAEVMEVTSQAERAIKKYIKNRKKKYETEIQEIESRPHISTTYSELLKNYMNLLNAPVHVHPKIVVTSSAKYLGFEELRGAIQEAANDRALFPNFRREIPTFWVDVEHFLEEKGNFMTIPVMCWTDYEDLVTKKFGLKHVLTSVTEYLHEVGKVLWFSKINTLKDHVFLRPSWLFEVFRYVFRSDIDSEEGCPVEWLKKTGMSVSRIERARTELVNEGIVEKDFVKGLLGPCVPHDLNQPFMQVLTLLIEGFGIGYPVQSKMKEGAYHLTLEPDADGKVKIARVFLPWYRKVQAPNVALEHWSSLNSRFNVVVVYNFHKYMPPGVLETFSVRLNKAGKHPIQFLAHWNDGIHIQHKTDPIQLVAHTRSDERGLSVTFDIKSVSTDETNGSIKALWEVLLPILMVFEGVLHDFPGCWVGRRVKCPHCQEASFLGEWLSPKDTQSLSVRPCVLCGRRVDTSFLVPPKEKKRDSSRRRTSRRASRLLADTKSLAETASKEFAKLTSDHTPPLKETAPNDSPTLNVEAIIKDGKETTLVQSQNPNGEKLTFDDLKLFTEIPSTESPKPQTVKVTFDKGEMTVGHF